MNHTTLRVSRTHVERRCFHPSRILSACSDLRIVISLSLSRPQVAPCLFVKEAFVSNSYATPNKSAATENTFVDLLLSTAAKSLQVSSPLGQHRYEQADYTAKTCPYHRAQSRLRLTPAKQHLAGRACFADYPSCDCQAGSSG